MPIIITDETKGVLPADIGLAGGLLSTRTPAVLGAAFNLVGDVTGSGAATIETAITAKAVTYAKIQDVAANSLLGNPTGSAATVTEINIGGGLSFSGDMLSIPGGMLSKFRNGRMDIAQHGSSSTVTTATTAYTLDGWQITPTGATAAWSQQYGTSMAGSCLRLSCVTGMSALNLQQRIESTLAAALLNFDKTAVPITVQFAIYNNSGGDLTLKLATACANSRDNFGAVTVDLAATNLQTIPNTTLAVVAYTWVPSINLANGYQVQLQFGSALNAGAGYVEVGYADLRATPGTPIGLNASPPAPESRPLSTELLICMRHFYSTYGNGGFSPGLETQYNARSGRAVAAATTLYEFNTALPVQMRAVPTITWYSPDTANSGKIFHVTGSNDATIDSTSFTATDVTGAPVFHSLSDANGAYQWHFTASAEL